MAVVSALDQSRSGFDGGLLVELVEGSAGQSGERSTRIGLKFLLRQAAVGAARAEDGKSVTASVDEHADLLDLAAQVEIGVVDVVRGEVQRQFGEAKRESG